MGETLKYFWKFRLKRLCELYPTILDISDSEKSFSAMRLAAFFRRVISTSSFGDKEDSDFIFR